VAVKVNMLFYRSKPEQQNAQWSTPAQKERVTNLCFQVRMIDMQIWFMVMLANICFSGSSVLPHALHSQIRAVWAGFKGSCEHSEAQFPMEAFQKASHCFAPLN